MTSDQEDYRVKDAREGRAIYVPGKTTAEIAAHRAAEAAQDAAVSSRQVKLTRKQWSELDLTIPDVIETFHDVSIFMFHISYLDDLGQPWVNAALRLAGQAMQRMETKEIVMLEQLDHAIRTTREGKTDAADH